MKIHDLDEGVGRIVKGVNTTQDVGVDEIVTQAKKFGNKVDSDGRPPQLRSGSVTNTLYNMGLAESVISPRTVNLSMDEASYTGNVGAMEVMRFFMQVKKNDVKLYDYVQKLSKSDDPEQNQLAWRIIQQYLDVKLQGKGFDNPNPDVTETASAGSTSSSSIATVANPASKKRSKKTHNPDGTIKNAAEVGDNIFSGTPIKRKKS